MAQELLLNLPKAKGIVKENKDKDRRNILSINYMKTSLILWKALQEEMKKQIEHLESSVYELQEAVKELKGKGKAKSKAKAKSKPQD